MIKDTCPDKNLLICADNLAALDDLIQKGIKVDLIYLDPPFFSNKHYEVVWGDEAEVRSFKDRWSGGLNVYVEWMKERVVKMYDVLKDSGSFYLHCDWHAGHYLKVLLDGVFGYKHFRNNIVWCYKTREFSKRYWNKKHDDILFYTKSDNYVFNWEDEKVLEPYSDATIKKYRYHDATGYYRLCGRGIKGSPIQSAKDVDLKWEKTNPELVVRNYLGKGYAPSDYWYIDIINQVAKERLGYPTQKPEALLERIVRASSKKGDIVLDPFCGCGTAMAVAQKTGRKWIGIDISPTAINIVGKRLDKYGAIKGKDYDIVGMPTTLTALQSLAPFEFQNWVINEMKARQSRKLTSDFGLDGYYDKTVFTDRAGVQVKQSEHVGRNVVDNFETALKRAKYEKGYIVAFSFGKGAHEEAARAKQDGLDIKLINVDDLLHGSFKV